MAFFCFLHGISDVPFSFFCLSSRSFDEKIEKEKVGFATPTVANQSGYAREGIGKEVFSQTRQAAIAL